MYFPKLYQNYIQSLPPQLNIEFFDNLYLNANNNSNHNNSNNFNVNAINNSNGNTDSNLPENTNCNSHINTKLNVNVNINTNLNDNSNSNENKHCNSNTNTNSAETTYLHRDLSEIPSPKHRLRSIFNCKKWKRKYKSKLHVISIILAFKNVFVLYM